MYRGLSADSFTVSDDRQANKGGFLGTSQRGMLQQMRWQLMVASWSMIALILLIPAFINWLEPTLAIANPGLYTGVVVGCVLFTFGFTGFLVRQRWLLQSDLEEAVVHQAEGIPKLKAIGNGANRALQVTLDAKTFTVTAALMPWFRPDRRYRIYYVPHSRTIVLLEALDPVDQPGIDAVLSLYVPRYRDVLHVGRREQPDRL